MIRYWLRALTVRWISGGHSERRSGPARGRRASLRVETLEDRTVTSTLHIEPPFLPEPRLEAGDLAVYIDPLSSPIKVLPGSSLAGGRSTPDGSPRDQSSDEGRDGVHRVHTTMVPLVGDSGLSLFGDSSGAGPEARAPEPNRSALRPDIEQTQDLPPTPRPVEPVAPVKNFDLPAADLKDRNAASDVGRVVQARGSSPVPAADSPPLTVGEIDFAPPLWQSQLTTDTGKLPAPDAGGWLASRSNGTAASLSQGETAEMPPRHKAPERLTAGLPDHVLPDHILLRRFAAEGEQAAFTALVQRHEGWVMAVCQRVLGDSHAALDACQVTFLVLARKASMLDREGSLTGWLYRVAYHLALRIRQAAARRRQVESSAAESRSPHAEDEGAAAMEKQELIEAVREELQRLPDKYRVPLVRCYFDRQTHADAAREIGLPRGSMAKRIGEGLERLRERLLDRGFLLSESGGLG